MPTTVPDTASSRQEIERARQEMGRALFLIADRLAPRKVVVRLKETARVKAAEKLDELKERVSPAAVLNRKLGKDSAVIPARGYESTGRSHSPALSRSDS